MPLVGGGWLPLAFFVTGLLALGGGALLLAAHARWLALPHFHPQLVGLAHLWLPGGLVAICIGACYQMAPVILGTPLRARRGAVWWHLGLHAAGVIGLVAAFFHGHYGLAAVAGTAVAAGTALLHGTSARTFVRSRRRDVVAWSLPIATGWLALTAFSGMLLAWNRHHPFLPVDVLGLLRAHAHAGLVGFFGSLLQGVTFQLVPMFTMGEFRRPRTALGGLALLQVGLAVQMTGLVGGWPALVRGGALAMAAALLLTGVALQATLASRRRRRWEIPLANFFAGAGLAVIAIGMGLLLVLVPMDDGLRLRGALAYSILLLGGALPLTVLGMLGKILPFLVWMKAYGPHVGRRTVPRTTQLGRPRLEAIWGGGQGLATVLLAVGVVTEQPALLTGGTALQAAALVIYLANSVLILRHLARPLVNPLPSRHVLDRPA